MSYKPVTPPPSSPIARAPTPGGPPYVNRDPEPASPGLSRAPWRRLGEPDSGQQTLRVALLHIVEDSEKLRHLKPHVQNDFELFLLQHFRPEGSDHVIQLAKFREYADMCLLENLRHEDPSGGSDPDTTRLRYMERISATLDAPTVILGMPPNAGLNDTRRTDDAYSYMDKHILGTAYTLRLTGNDALEASHMLIATPKDVSPQAPWIPIPEYEIDMEGVDVVYLLDRTSTALVDRSTGEELLVIDVQLPEGR
ncbi:hypothetical protein EUX98_g2860 [Antrodiella citrinella]|uniref:Uncharacterized protein n=1 Tax=Antrodiella citrinella TaxID=2447956 RepID=A0A4S4N0R5_9APHY|nr:hypothetical protein EUX98_g2860 [Antrodiella citrinella]